MPVMKTLLSLFSMALLLCTGLLAQTVPVIDGPVKIEQAEKLRSEGIQVLDVRTKEEWDAGHLAGAKRVDFTEEKFLEKSLTALDLKKPVLVYCRSGNRSKKAAEILRKAGFPAVYEMEGGIVAWEAAGKPIEK